MHERPQVAPAQSEWRKKFHDAREHEPALAWNYAVKGWLRIGECSVIYGPSNCGKSSLVCHLGHCIVTGRPFFGARAQRGAVVHVGAEAPESILDRMQAYDVHGPGAAPYFVRNGSVDLSNPEEVLVFVQHLKEIIEDIGTKIALLVFDTLARSIGLTDENNSTAMTEIAKAAELIARSVGTHVMLVHHTGKDHDRGSRGSSALRGAVDTEISLKPQDDGTVVVTQEKQRTMVKGRAVRFTTESMVLGLDEDGEDRTTARAVELSGACEKEPAGSSGRGSYDIKSAVLIILHNRSMNGSRERFEAADILAALPDRLFGNSVRDSRLKSINRILAHFASETEALVEGKPGAWCLRQGDGDAKILSAT